MLPALIIYYFFSFSIPSGSLEISLDQMSKITAIEMKGVLVGIDKEGIEFLKKSVNKNKKLTKIIIDPREFKKNNIKRVPVYMLVAGEKSYILSGDISPDKAIRIFYKHTKMGELKKALKELGE